MFFYFVNLLLQHRTELDDIMDELLERTSGPTVLGETLIATGPERLGSLGPGYLDQTGEQVSHCNTKHKQLCIYQPP